MNRALLLLGLALVGTTFVSVQAPRLAFEATDVRIHAHPDRNNVTGGVVRGGRYDLRNATMLDHPRLTLTGADQATPR